MLTLTADKKNKHILYVLLNISYILTAENNKGK